MTKQGLLEFDNLIYVSWQDIAYFEQCSKTRSLQILRRLRKEGEQKGKVYPRRLLLKNDYLEDIKHKRSWLFNSLHLENNNSIDSCL